MADVSKNAGELNLGTPEPAIDRFIFYDPDDPNPENRTKAIIYQSFLDDISAELGGDLPTHIATIGNGAHIPAGGIVNAQVDPAAAIAWTKLNKSGALPADVGCGTAASQNADNVNWTGGNITGIGTLGANNATLTTGTTTNGTIQNLTLNLQQILTPAAGQNVSSNGYQLIHGGVWNPFSATAARILSSTPCIADGALSGDVAYFYNTGANSVTILSGFGVLLGPDIASLEIFQHGCIACEYNGTDWIVLAHNQYVVVHPSPTSIVLQSGWGNVSGYGTASIIRRGGMATLQGLLSRTNGVTNGQLIATIPVGYRPAQKLRIPPLQFNQTDGTQTYLDIETDGDITIGFSAGSQSVTWFAAIGCSFPIV